MGLVIIALHCLSPNSATLSGRVLNKLDHQWQNESPKPAPTFGQTYNH